LKFDISGKAKEHEFENITSNLGPVDHATKGEATSFKK
jgi:hypothetical protein